MVAKVAEVKRVAEVAKVIKALSVWLKIRLVEELFFECRFVIAEYSNADWLKADW